MGPAVANEVRLASAKAVVLGLVVGVLLFAADGAAFAAGSPTVSITPGPAKGAFADQQNVRVSVGSNSVFTPNSRVVILECADPDGTVANLPTGFSSCDENTIQPDTTVVHADGSFVEPSYTLYALPSKLLGEQANWQPVCNTAHPCVLFVGEDQNDFSKAKTFSPSFTMSGGTLSAAPTTATTTPATTASAPVSAAVSLGATQLAFTGTSGWLIALGAIGAALVVLAWALATLVRRSAR
jgi:hypothetical protein